MGEKSIILKSSFHQRIKGVATKPFVTRTCYSQAEILGLKDAPAVQTLPSQKTAKFSGKAQMQQCELATKTDSPLVCTAALVAATSSVGSAPVTRG